jgi:SAM-dependent methyltransferase
VSRTTPARCPNCGGDSSPALRARDFNRRIDSVRFAYDRCRRCGLVFLVNTPADLSTYYPTDYYPLAASREELSIAAQGERYKIDLVKRYVGSGELIEVGPGGGGFAYLAREAGFHVRVIEMSPLSCRFLSDVVGVRTTCTCDERQALADGAPADVIALWHVIEHLTGPFDLVRTAASKLKPGGILVVAAPSPHALQFRLLGARWTHLDAPRHVHLIPPGVLVSVAADAGLRVLLETTTDDGSVGWNHFGWRHSLGNMARGSRSRDWAMRAGERIARMLAPLETREGVGSAYTLVFERPA